MLVFLRTGLRQELSGEVLGSRLTGDRRPFCHENTGYGLFAQNFLQIKEDMPPRVVAAPCEGELAGFQPPLDAWLSNFFFF